MTKLKKQIVIVGGNFAGVSALKSITRQSGDSLQVTLIDSGEYFTWTPSIHEILSGGKSPSSVQVNRGKLVQSLGGHFIQDSVTQIEEKQSQLTLNSGANLSFDAAILATGMAPRQTPQSDSYFFRNAQDATQITAKIALLTHLNKQVNITIVGGGFTGTEILGELLRRYRQSPNIKINLIERGASLVRSLPDAVSDDILRLSQSLPVSFHFEQQVVDHSANELVLDNGVKLPSDITIYSNGAAAPATQSDVITAEMGRASAVNEYLQSPLAENLFFAGDCATIASGDSELPKQSYYAQEMGKLAGHNTLRLLDTNMLRAFNPVPKPVLLSFGDMNTYLISGDLVLASPALASMKEMLQQLGMQKIMACMPAAQRTQTLFTHLTQAANTLFSPDTSPYLPSRILKNSKVLQSGAHTDFNILTQSVFSTLLD